MLASIGAGRRPLTLAVDRSLQDIARGAAGSTSIGWDAAGADEAVGVAGGPGAGDEEWRPCVRATTGPVVASVDLTRRLVALAPSETPRPSAAASTVRPCSGGGRSPWPCSAPTWWA